MNVSAVSPIDRAFARMRVALFHDFNLSKWLTLGLSAWLAGLGSGGGGGGGNGFNTSKANMPSGGDAIRFLEEYWVFIAIGVVVVVAIGLAIMALLQWLSSRGMFMFYDNVVTDRALIAEPWRRYRAPAWHLFIFRFVLGIIAWLVGAAIVVGGVVFAWPDLAAEQLTMNGVVSLAVGIPLLVGLGFAVLLVKTALVDFIVPLMASRGILSVPDAFRMFIDEVLSVSPGMCVLYFIMRFLLGFAVTLVTLALCCVTCGIAGCLFACPYVGAVILLPVAYFFRAYSLYFIEQFGPHVRVFPVPGSQTQMPPEAPVA